MVFADIYSLLLRDTKKLAIKNAVTLPWSDGPQEFCSSISFDAIVLPDQSCRPGPAKQRKRSRDVWTGVPRSRQCTTMVFIGLHLGILGDEKSHKYPRNIGLI